MVDKLGARKDEQWMAISIEPSIDYTWIGPVRVPIPYTVVADLGQSIGTSPNVFFNGKPAYLFDQSKQLQCIGDEHGGGGGIHSGTNLGEVKPLEGSKTVRINGKSVIREGDLCTMNNENCKGKYYVVPKPLSKNPNAPSTEIFLNMRIIPADLEKKRPAQVIAIAFPKGGEFEWRHSRNCRLIDASGQRSHVGDKLQIQMLTASDDEDVLLTVKYKHPEGEASATRNYRTRNLQEPTSLYSSALNEVVPKDGFIIVGQDRPKPVEKKTIKKEVAIACFIDGTDNDPSSQTNVRIMYEKVLNETNATNDYVVSPHYVVGPGAEYNWTNWRAIGMAGELIGTFSSGIVSNMYDQVVDQYLNLLEDGYTDIKIDIYGFSRGAAIANEVAWTINNRGIQFEEDKPVVAPEQAKVRFLGLFDTVHSMGWPGPNSSKDWHDANIPGNVENCAHALAGNETRVYFAPSILRRELLDKGADIIQMIFPGVHSDVGGHHENNQDIMKVTRSWMSENAGKAGVPYLKAFVLSTAEIKALKNDPIRMKAGPEGYPKVGEIIGDKNPLNFDDEVEMLKLSGGPYSSPTNAIAYSAALTLQKQFSRQPKLMHERRNWKQYDIDWFIPPKDLDPKQGTKK